MSLANLRWVTHTRSVAGPPAEDVALAQELLRLWDEGRGLSKSQLEIKTWDDATSHGRHFDRFVRKTLGVSTTKKSKQTDRITDLETQVRGLGRAPVGVEALEWELQLQHARESCLQGLRVWNDPTSTFRTGTFSMLFVTAWNSLAIAALLRDGREWREIDDEGHVVLFNGGSEKALGTSELIELVFGGEEHFGLRHNVRFWLDLRNSVAHRRLPALDAMVIPHAQAGLLNIEEVLNGRFGPEFGIGEALSVPLQLSGFRDPEVLASRKRLMAALPLDVQGVISRAETASADLLSDPTFMLRVAFVPAVPPSGRNPDSIAYFVPPGDVPEELAETLDRYVVLAKPQRSAAKHRAGYVKAEFERRVGFKLGWNHHGAAARKFGAWPETGPASSTVSEHYAEWNSAFKSYLYTQAWIDLLVDRLATPDGFLEATGSRPCELLVE